MKVLSHYVSKYKEVIILIGTWMIAILLVNPIGNFPLNDDRQYAFPVQQLVEDGVLKMKGYFSPNIILQVGWGALWCLMGGVFSFTFLRFSTLVLAVLGTILFFHLCKRLGFKPNVALVGALVFLSSPLYFNLSFSFMTDVPFVMLLIGTNMAALAYMEVEKWKWLILICILSIGSFLIRQPGILFLPIFGAWVILNERGSLKSWMLFFGFTILGVATYFGYDKVIKPLIGISDNFLPVSSLYLNTILEQPLIFVKELFKKFVKIWIYFGFYALPILPFVWPRVRSTLKFRPLQIVGILAANLALLYYLHSIQKIFPFGGNILYNYGLGPELLKDVYTLQIQNTPQLPIFNMYGLNFISQISATILCMLIWKNRTSYTSLQQRFFSFLLLFSLGYLLVMSILNFFDRYIMFPIVVFFLLLLPFAKVEKSSWKTYIPLILMGVFSLLATHDYLSWNRAKHEAFNWLQANEVSITEMDAGFEYNGFYNFFLDRDIQEGQSHWWITDDTWTISFGSIPKHDIAHKIEYRRWLWGGKKDFIHILRKTAG